MSSVATGAPRERVPERQLEQVADHPLALCVEQVERVGGDLAVGGRLEREQPDLGAVAVGEDERALGGELRERAGRGLDAGPLPLGVGGLAATQERVASERDQAARRGLRRHAGSALVQSPVASV